VRECLFTVLVSVGDRDSAQDLVAEAFARAWASWRTVELRPEPSITLTARGRDALGGYRTRAARRGDHGLRDCLDAIVSQREALPAGLGPPDGCWRAGRPYLAQTRRVLADPTAALPWNPMVLHRGGWPDGS
jgi:hypothetical protein